MDLASDYTKLKKTFHFDFSATHKVSLKPQVTEFSVDNDLSSGYPERREVKESYSGR